jgi:hypothetical protein
MNQKAVGSFGAAGASLSEGEPCRGPGVAEEESIPALVPLRRAEGASLLLSSCDYRLHIGI